MKKRLLSTFLALCLVLGLLPGTARAAKNGADSDNTESGLATTAASGSDIAYPVTGGNIYFNEKTGWITDCDESVTKAAIPSIINGIAVTSIGTYAFSDCYRLTNVDIPNSVTYIRCGAFSDCRNLTKINIPTSVTYIDMEAFWGCSKLVNINIPDGVPAIERNTFYACKSLTNIVLPDSVTAIGSSAFSGCTSLSSIIIPGNVKSIGVEAFYDCNNLTNITISDGVPIIDWYAFSCCRGLTSITIPSSVRKIDWDAFQSCSKLKDVYYAGDETQWKEIWISPGNEYLTEATIHYNSTGPDRPVIPSPDDPPIIPKPDDPPNQDDISAYYIEAMDFGDLVINSSGTATAYYCVKDKDGNPLSGKTLQYELTGKDGVTTVKTDSNGLFGVTTPRLTKSASFWATISSDNSSIEVFNKDQFFDVQVKKLSYAQEWTGACKLGGEIGPAFGAGAEAGTGTEETGAAKLELSLAKLMFGVDFAQSLSIKDDYNDGKRTLTLNSAGKHGIGLSLGGGLTAQITEANKVTPIGGSIKATILDQIGGGLKIENFDQNNLSHIKQLGSFALASSIYTQSALINRLLRNMDRNICNVESAENSVGLEGGIDVLRIKFDSCDFDGALYGFNKSSLWKWKESFDYTGRKTFTISKSLKTAIGEGIGSGVSVEVKNDFDVGLGKYVFGADLSNNKEILAVRQINSGTFDSISYKVYDGDEADFLLNSASMDTYSTVTFNGSNAMNIINGNSDIANWVSGKNPFINIQDTIDYMRLSGNIANIKQTSKVKRAVDFGVQFGFEFELKAKLKVGVSGEHSFNWDEINGVYYNGTVYNTAISDVKREDVEASARKDVETSTDGLDDLLIKAVNAVMVDLVRNIIKKSGLASDGVKSGALEVSGDDEYWFVVISTVEADNISRSAKDEESFAVISLLSEDDSENYATAFATLGEPYEIAVFTDENQAELVNDAELAKNPLNITLRYTDEMLESAGAPKDSEVMLLRFDEDKKVYVREADVVQDKDNMVVTAKMTKNGEYILAVDSIAEEPPILVPAIYTITFDADNGSGSVSTATAVENTAFVLPVCTFTAPAGKEFKAWSIDGKEYAPGAAYTFVADTTVAAVWQDAAPAPEHTHTWETAWHYDATHHWHECSTSECPITENSSKSEYGEHTWDKENGTVCSTCEYQRAVNPQRPTEEGETYYISIPSITNGEIIPNTRYASPGERVTLTAHPDKGYKLDTITVTDIRGHTLVLRELSGNSYRFAMPDNRVTVNSSFAKIEDNTSSASAPADDEPFTGLGTPGISGIVLNPAPMPFTDVRAGDWFYGSVDYVWKHYLMSGVSGIEFSPNTTTSRAMIWTVLARMNNVRTEVNPGSNWYERGMLWAMEQGITDGSNPMGDITREQLATMLWRNAGSPSATADLSRFRDSGSVSDYAKSAVNWAVANGILNGSDGKLNLKGTATRAQVAAMVMRYGERVGA